MTSVTDTAGRSLALANLMLPRTMVDDIANARLASAGVLGDRQGDDAHH